MRKAVIMIATVAILIGRRRGGPGISFRGQLAGNRVIYKGLDWSGYDATGHECGWFPGWLPLSFQPLASPAKVSTDTAQHSRVLCGRRTLQNPGECPSSYRRIGP